MGAPSNYTPGAFGGVDMFTAPPHQQDVWGEYVRRAVDPTYATPRASRCAYCARRRGLSANCDGCGAPT